MAEPAYDIAYPRGGAHASLGRVRHLLRPALVPATWLYGIGSDTVRRVRSLERPGTPDDVTVVSVGNLEVGGSGKTPLCIHLLERAIAAGKPAGYVSRGFGSAAERFAGVTLVGETWPGGRGTRWVDGHGPGLAAAIGDEGAVVAARVPSARLAFSRDKARAVAMLAPQVRGGIVVLDDALQSWGVARDVDVVLIDARRPFGDGWMLPAGTLRESPEAIGRADVVVLNGSADPDRVRDVRAHIHRISGRELPCRVMTRTVAVDVPAGEPVVVASAIARPDRFEESLIERGVAVEAALRFPDHHGYTSEDAALIRAAGGGRRCVVTEKDWVKLRDLGCDEAAFIVARLDTRLDEDIFE